MNSSIARGRVPLLMWRGALGATLIMLVSAQTTQEWGSELALPDMTTRAQSVPEETGITFDAEPFAGITPARFTATDETSISERLVYDDAPYRAEIVYWQNRSGYSLIYTILGSDPANPTGWEYFTGKQLTPDGTGKAPSPVGEIRYARFSTPESACFRFQVFWEFGSIWEERTRMLGGYVCRTDVAQVSHAEIAGLLAHLGVRGKEPEQTPAPDAPAAKRDRTESSNR